MKDKRISYWLYWMIPIGIFLTAETVMGNLSSISPLCIILNLVLYYICYLGVYVISQTTKGWAILHILFYILAVIEYFVISFRERPAMIWDVLAIRTAMTVSANYNYTITPTLLFSALAVIGASIFSWKYPIKMKVQKKRARIFWGSGSAVFLILLFQWIAPKFQLDVPMWDPVVSFEKEGVVLSTALSFKSVIPPKPEGYTAIEAEALLDQSGLKKSTEELSESISETILPTNVICIMNESFSDLRLFNHLVEGRSFETDQSFLDFYDSLSNCSNVQKGNLYVPVFGAMTANSEYEVLTGHSCAFVPQGSIPYQFFTKEGDISLASIFKEEGYQTIAMHPYPGYNWNRTKAYKNLGFEQFLDQTYYDELEENLGIDLVKPRNYMSDESDYDAILHVLREKKKEEKMFLFNVTMQNHGGFEVADLKAEVHVTQINGRNCEGEYPKADQYLTLMQMSDRALEHFFTELEKIDEPTMVVLFGDHQPSVETEFFEALYGMRWTEVPDELKLHSFQTPYLIWTNYERSTEDIGDMSAFLLGSEILKVSGIEPKGIFNFADSLKTHYDAVHAMGVLEKDGTFSESSVHGGFDRFTDIRDYHVLQYYEMFD